MVIGPAAGYNPWDGPVTSLVTAAPMLCYRIWGGKAARIGRLLTPTRPTSRGVTRAGLALPPGNAATDYTEVWLPAGARIQTGTAAANFGEPGGWPQIELLHGIPTSCFGTDAP